MNRPNMIPPIPKLRYKSPGQVIIWADGIRVRMRRVEAGVESPQTQLRIFEFDDMLDAWDDRKRRVDDCPSPLKLKRSRHSVP